MPPIVSIMAYLCDYNGVYAQVGILGISMAMLIMMLELRISGLESFFVPMYESYSKRKDSKSLAGSPMSEQHST